MVPEESLLPDGWKSTTIASISTVRRGASPRPIRDPKWFSSTGPGWVRIADVTRASNRLRETEQYLSPLGESKSVRIAPGSLIMSIAGTIGKPIISNIDACIHDGFVVFRDIDAGVDIEFLYCFLREQEQKFADQGQPGTQKNINTTIVGKMGMPLPPLSEQRKIAAILGSVDALIERTQAVIDQLEVVKKGLMQELLTRGLPGRHTRFKQTEIGEIPESWEVAPLALFVERIDSGWSPKCGPDPAEDGEWGVLKVSAASWGRFRPEENKRLPMGVDPRPDAEVKAGDLILSRANTSKLIGRPVFATATRARLMLSDKLLRLTPKEGVLAGYLKVALGSSSARKQIVERSTGSSDSMKNISKKRLRTIVLPLPGYPEQAEIASCIDDIDSRYFDDIAFLQGLDAVKSALSTALLSGQLRVTPDEGPAS